MTNKTLDALHPYPFERMNELLAGVSPPDVSPIAWSIGEPAHPAPDFIVDALTEPGLMREGLGAYPPTKGLPELRSAIASFLARRYNLSRTPDAETQVLPVNGTREALFSFAQATLSHREPGLTLMPNPFYQIYEGAAILAGSKPHYLNCTATTGFLPDLSRVATDVWRDCGLIYVCTPGNPTGAVAPIEWLRQLIELADEFDFVIASDECYSEIYPNEAEPPPGLLEAAASMGRDDFRDCVAFNSLSKRSNLPGLRSGYVAGDARLLELFLKYRTYHGSAMPVQSQLVSAMAWADEAHVVANRELYRRKFSAVVELLAPCWPVEPPQAAFYLWPETPVADTEFAQRLYREANVKVLPGSFLSRQTPDGNPGANRVRIALVATLEECLEGAARVRDNWERLAAN